MIEYSPGKRRWSIIITAECWSSQNTVRTSKAQKGALGRERF